MNIDRLWNWKFEEIIHTYSERDCIIYALGIGLGSDPMDKRQLRYVYEGGGLAALPTMATVLCHPGPWTSNPATGIVREKQVHGEQGLKLHRPLAPTGRLRGRTRVTGIVDKGTGRGALVYTERDLFDDNSNELVATLSSTTFCRGNGGFGGSTGPVKPLYPIPAGQADIVVEWPTISQAALLYRLNGDLNPLHADSEFAAKAGFQKPILHGLATFGMAAWAAMVAYGDANPDALESIHARFSAPVMPGETVRFELWRNGQEVSIRAWGMDSGQKVLDNGVVRLR